MSHIIIILDETIELLESKYSSPPSDAQLNLMAALEAAHAYAHTENPDEGILDQIEALATWIKMYLTYANPPSDIRLQSDADTMQGIIPG